MPQGRLKSMLRLLFLCVLLGGTLAAHPLDDRAFMTSELSLLPGGSMELAVEFRYNDVLASYTEFGNGLDRNRDGCVTRGECNTRLLEVADLLAFSVQVRVDGSVVTLEPAMERAEFRDLNDATATPDQPGGMPLSSTRIFYRLVFAGTVAPAPGQTRQGEYEFSGLQSVIERPTEQMAIVDARNSTRLKLEAAHGTGPTGFPLARFSWRDAAAPAAAPSGPPQVAAPAPTTALPPAPTALPRLGGLLFGLALALAGLGMGIAGLRGTNGRAGSLLTAALLLLAGAAVLAGALLQPA